jgi:carboxypeptidase family protein
MVCGALLPLSPLLADTPSIQGLVLNTEGKPVPGAEVRADRADVSAKRVTVRTNSDGRYVFNSLPAGRYSITVVAESGAHTQGPRIATVPTIGDSGQPIRRFISPLPYQVKPDFRSGTPAQVRAQYVWKPGETGSHIGGRWIKVSDADKPSANPLETLGGSDFNRSPYMRVNSAAK